MIVSPPARACVAWLSVLALTVAATAQTVRYPETKRTDHVDELHGVSVADPYRWLEDLDAEETAHWVAAQNEVTFEYLQQIPVREKIKQRLTALWDYEKFSIPTEKGGRYFFTRNDGLQNQSVLYMGDGLAAEPRVLLNPNEWSEDGTVALSGRSVTDDGKLMAYQVSAAGSDWREIKVLNVDTGEHLSDNLKWVKFSGAAWDKQSRGFYYNRYDEPPLVDNNKYQDVNKFQKLFYHAIGTPQSQDELVFHTPDEPEWGSGGSVTEDGRYLIISISQGTERKNRIYYRDLKSDTPDQTVKLLDDFDAQYELIGNDGPVFWFYTDLEAPRGRVIAIDTAHPERENWKELIPQSEDTLRGVSLVNHQFLASYLKDACTQVRVFGTDGTLSREVELPGIGSASGFGGQPDDTETFYSYTSFSTPPTIYRYDLTTGQSTVWRQPKVDFDQSHYETRQIFFPSKDGTKVPMFITHRKGLKLDGDNATYLYGYGGFNIALTPQFSISNLVWLEMGGVYAQACLRGGGEYGKDWHHAGKLENKQNVFDDFQAAADWLIRERYTRKEKLAIGGGSNGGLLVGACLTQRPDLYGAALPAVGVLDMLRFHKFTIGWAWTSDYGSPDEAEMFEVLRAYSPYHNVKAGTCYPPTMITTGDHDDRVVPSHSFKFASALQAAQGCDNPILIRIETRAGHGAGKPTTKIIEEQADRWAFLVKNLGVDTAVSAN
jgi:prolyl oligopeptidase